MPLTTAERQKRFREKKKAIGKYEDFKAKHAEEVRKCHAKQKEKEKLLSTSAYKRLLVERRLAVKNELQNIAVV